MLIRIFVAVVLWACAAAAPGFAQQRDAAPAGKTATQDKQDKKDKKDKQKPKSDVPAPDEPIDAQAPDPDAGEGFRVTWKQHPSLRIGDVFRLDFQAKFQEDGRSSYTTRDLEPWELHRNRIGVSGHLFKHIEYEVERELTEKELTEDDVEGGVRESSHWKDVFVDLTFIDNAQVQIGKFKIPFGLDQTTGVSQNDFVYRSLGANYLSPARDIGVVVHGRFFKRGLGYWVGAFRHDGDNARSKKIEGADETIALRLTGMPLRAAHPWFELLEIGGAVTSSRLKNESFNPNGLRGRTVMTHDVFYEPVYVNGRRNRFEADLDWPVGPVGFRTEYTQVRDDRLGQGILDEDLEDARGQSWYFQSTWLVTGEKKERPVKPNNPFLQGGIGAVEVGARYERLWFDSLGNAEAYRSPRAEKILTASERALTVGVNWTLNRFIKLQFNGIREEIFGIRERVEIADREPVPSIFWSRIFRLQLVL